jgi:hypothetical protein
LGRKAEFELSLTEARRTQRGESPQIYTDKTKIEKGEKGEKGDGHRLKGEGESFLLFLRVLRASVRLIAS